jgi:hypothetical protein
VTGAVTEAPLTVAVPTAHDDPSGSVTLIGWAGNVTASPKVSAP